MEKGADFLYSGNLFSTQTVSGRIGMEHSPPTRVIPVTGEPMIR